LSYNNINDAGGELLAISLRQNTTLIRLNLKRNNLRETSGLLFIDMIQMNKYIEYLNLNKNIIKVSILEAV
jgi:hypothetical protein